MIIEQDKQKFQNIRRLYQEVDNIYKYERQVEEYVKKGNTTRGFTKNIGVNANKRTFTFKTFKISDEEHRNHLQSLLNSKGIFKSYHCSMCTIPYNNFIGSIRQNDIKEIRDYASNNKIVYTLEEYPTPAEIMHYSYIYKKGRYEYFITANVNPYYKNHLLFYSQAHLHTFSLFYHYDLFYDVYSFINTACEQDPKTIAYFNGNSGSDPHHFHLHFTNQENTIIDSIKRYKNSTSNQNYNFYQNDEVTEGRELRINIFKYDKTKTGIVEMFNNVRKYYPQISEHMKNDKKVSASLFTTKSHLYMIININENIKGVAFHAYTYWLKDKNERENVKNVEKIYDSFISLKDAPPINHVSEFNLSDDMEKCVISYTVSGQGCNINLDQYDFNNYKTMQDYRLSLFKMVYSYIINRGGLNHDENKLRDFAIKSEFLSSYETFENNGEVNNQSNIVLNRGYIFLKGKFMIDVVKELFKNFALYINDNKSITSISNFIREIAVSDDEIAAEINTHNITLKVYDNNVEDASLIFSNAVVMSGLLNSLRDQHNIPNFVYTFGHFTCKSTTKNKICENNQSIQARDYNYMLLEYLYHNIPLSKFFLYDNVDTTTLIMQIFLALIMAYDIRKISFVNLTIDSLFVVQYDKQFRIKYSVDNTDINISTNNIVVIREIDNIAPDPDPNRVNESIISILKDIKQKTKLLQKEPMKTYSDELFTLYKSGKLDYKKVFTGIVRLFNSTDNTIIINENN
jgi:hypothetical protein